MDIKQLESFVCIARTGSMTSASEVLYLTTPALAQQLNRLEREVRVPLFTRSPRGMTLTPAGEVFLEDAQQILEMTQRMLNRCRETEARAEHTVCIGSIKGLVPDFYPGIQHAVRSHCPEIQLEHMEDTPEGLCQALLDGRIDAMELYDAPMTRSPLLRYIPLISEGRSCLMMPDHPLASRKKITLEDLVDQNVYIYEFARVPGLKEYVQTHCPKVQIRCENAPAPQNVSSYYITLKLCGDGGICLITPHCAGYFAPLVAVPLDIPLTWSAGLVCRRVMRKPMQTVLDATLLEYDTAGLQAPESAAR